MSGAKMRVYEIAREVGLPNKELIAKIRTLGLEVNNHMSSLGIEDVARVKRSLAKERVDNTVTKRLSKTVLRRRSKNSDVADAAPNAATPVVRRRAVAVVEPAEEKAKPKPVIKIKTPATAAANAPAPAVEPESPAPAAKAEEPAVAVAEPVVAAPEPETPKPAAKKPRGPIVVKGPEVVQIPGQPAPPPKVVQPEPEPTPEPAKAEPRGPKTVAEVAGTARSRFEAELERARSQAAERDRDRQRRKTEAPEPPAAAEKRPDGRPEVGSVISLPAARIKITERGPSGRQMPGQGQVRGRYAQQQMRGGRRGRPDRRKQVRKGQGKATQITTPAEHKRVIRMQDTITVHELAHNMGIKANEALRKLWGMGMLGITINTSIDYETAQILASEFGYEVQNVAFKEEDVFASEPDGDEDRQGRAPVVTVMGHVDHGKTSLLDHIRKARVASGEAGGITQHIGAYKVNVSEEYGDVVFLDTPGHAAFTEMRARGAQATDIVILIVAADDGVMPQTAEAVTHAKDAGVTIIVAVNKCDLPNAQPDRPRQQLAEHGLIPEEWGGDTIYCNVSAKTGEGIDELLESVAVNAELLELKANPEREATGVVIEAKLDRSRGPMTTLLVQEGTLRVGDIVVVGEHMGKVRALLDDLGRNVQEAGPSTPVEVLGIDGVPEAGEMLNATKDEKLAKQVVEHRRLQKRKKELATTGKISLENLMQRFSEGEAQELKVVLKADVHGSAEALKRALVDLSTEKVAVNVISAGVGGITESDVNLAKAGGAIIVGFHVRTAGKSAKLADQEGVQIKIYDIIYEALDDVKSAMAGLLAPIRREQDIGKIEVRETYTIPRRGVVAGCMVVSGKVLRKSPIRVVRDSVQLHSGKLSSLKRFKDDVSEVKENFECGLMVDGFNDIQIGDIIEVYEIVEEAATL